MYLNDVEYYKDPRTGIKKEETIPACEFCSLNSESCKLSESCQIQKKINATIPKFSYGDSHGMKMDIIKKYFYTPKARGY